MDRENLTHLIYTSAASPAFNPADLERILRAARAKNALRSITGMLLYTSGTFFQVLEGEEADLAEVFAVISADPRHENVTLIIQEPVAQRTFGEWTMGYAEVAPSELELIDGFSDYFGQGNSLARLPPGRAKKILSAFGQGRWRAQISAAAN